MSTATLARTGLSCLELWAERTPAVVTLAVKATVGNGDQRKSQATLRDDLLALARESAERSYREFRRGVDDFDALTRPGDEPGAHPHRPYRVKL